MAHNQTKRLAPKILQSDIDALNAIRGITGYTPSKSTFALTALEASHTAMTGRQTEESQALNVAAAKRDTANTAEWEFHNLILGAKDQIRAQYGDDSDEYQSLGLKKKSERKRASGRKPGGTT